jgi:hypothetical protein
MRAKEVTVLKKVFAAAVLLAVVVLGIVQLATRVEAAPRHCQLVLCVPCPDGYVLSPLKGNCCRCVPIP